MGLGLFAYFGGGKVSRLLTFQLLLRQEAPSETAVFESVSHAPQPVSCLRSLWDTGKIPHRHLAIKYIHQELSTNPEDFSTYEIFVFEALADADFANRELAMGILDAEAPENQHEMTLRSLRDPDQGTRLRALQFVDASEDTRWMHELMRLLDDPDDLIVAHAASKLRLWSGEDFGIRMMHAISRQAANSDLNHKDVLSRGVADWKQWWKSGKHAFPVFNGWGNDIKPFETPALPVEDFEVGLLDGSTRRLSDFRGKAVLLNFWTTWCSACMTEMPDLNQLHDLFPETLQVIGISLDGGEDHGHEHASIVDLEEAREVGLEAVEAEYGSDVNHQEQSASHEHTQHGHAHEGADIERVRKKIERVVQKKELKYLIGIDSRFQIGSRFNGQELPTNVLIDPQGKLRRRFVGTRPLHSWIAMLKDIGIPEASLSE